MSLSSLLQPAFAATHLFSLAILIAIAAGFRQRRWATALSLVAIVTSGFVTIGLALFLLALLTAGGGPGIIPPIAFAGGFVGGFLAYLLLLVLALAFRPRPPQLSPTVWYIALLIFAAFNGIFLALPIAATTTVTVYVRSTDSKPIAGATFTYKTAFEKRTFSETSDSAGRIALHTKLGDTIDGRFVPSTAFGQVELHISSPKGGRTRWGIMRRWSVSFGADKFAFNNFFIGGFDDSRGHLVEVCLPLTNRVELLPYTALSHLASRLQEAQRTGRMFNPEMNVQNLESYRQLSEVAQAYDPHSSVSGYAHDIFTLLAETRNALESIVKKLADERLDPAIRDRGLSQMLSTLQISTPDSLSWQEKRDLIQARLDSDAAILKSVQRP